MRVIEIRVKQIRVNQGLGVYKNEINSSAGFQNVDSSRKKV